MQATCDTIVKKALDKQASALRSLQNKVPHNHRSLQNEIERQFGKLDEKLTCFNVNFTERCDFSDKTIEQLREKSENQLESETTKLQKYIDECRDQLYKKINGSESILTFKLETLKEESDQKFKDNEQDVYFKFGEAERKQISYIQA